jgi:type IV pilus biogenesis/stability protein PilW
LGAAALLFSGCASLKGNRDLEKAKLYLQLATDQFNERDYGRAMESIRESLKFDPSFAPAYNHLALIYLETKRYQKSEEAFNKALTLQPDYPEVLNNLGVLLNRQERYKEAIPYFEKAVANEHYMTPENAYTNLGYAYYRLGRMQLAKSYHQKALDVAPMFCLASKNMGDVYAKEKNYPKASEYFQKAVTNCPLYQESQYKLGLILMKMGQRNVAKNQFERLVEHGKTGPYVERSHQVLKYLQ